MKNKCLNQEIRKEEKKVLENLDLISKLNANQKKYVFLQMLNGNKVCPIELKKMS